MIRHFSVSLLLFALVAAIAGCSGGSDSHSDAAAPTTAASVTTLAAGPPAFLADVRAMKFNGRSAAGADDIGLLEAGNMVCEGFGNGSDFGPMVQGLLESELHPTVEQASTIVRSAVRNLCPQYSATVPG